MSNLNDLTPPQQQAVEHIEGPLLVLAGPGSGKTRVITRRIASLIENGVRPHQILAITFTNKAANEMASRVEDLIPDRRVWISTFHRFCARLLRSRADLVGLQSNFSILDSTDQQTLMRQILNDLDFDTVQYAPGKIAAIISRAKNKLQSAEEFERARGESIGTHLDAVASQVYRDYQQRLRTSNAVDFDDLLLHVVTILSENPELRSDLDERFRYVLVDEYQDTNLAQYRIVAALSQDHPNLCVTGDPDQSIYGWRGAQIDNILRFESEFPQARVVRLEENFRSTASILRTADCLIANNVQRKSKSLTTSNPDGTPVQLLTFEDGHQEAELIARRIRKAFEDDGRKWSDFAIFYRVNSLSRELEHALNRQAIPYQVVAGLAFYERAEVKDLLAYLRLVNNRDDRAAFLRVVNKPLRGIGKTTQSKLNVWANSQNRSLWEAAVNAKDVPGLSKRAVGLLTRFVNLIESMSMADAGSVADLMRTIIDKIDYTRPWEGSPSEQDLQRLSNVNEFLSAAEQYDEQAADERSLEGFLETVSLATDVDRFDESAGRVALMTLHAAKGLEFPAVYVVGVEEELIPHKRSTRENDPKQIEEERRLLFVGMTRAMEELYLTQTRRRAIHGRMLETIRSPFLGEMDLVDVDCSEFEWAPDHAWISQTAANSDLGDDANSAAPTLDRRKPLLTTGAALLNGESHAAEIPAGFSMGMQVRHPRHGLGTVVELSGFSKRRTLTVEFQQDGRRVTYIASKCPLQPVGSG